MLLDINPQLQCSRDSGLDSNSEIPDYANSVDIWSLGCVINKLLYLEEHSYTTQRAKHHFTPSRNGPFSNINSRAIIPIDDLGISLLNLMLGAQPEGRPTGVKPSEQEQRRQTNYSTQTEGGRRDQRNPTTRDGSKSVPGGVALAADLGSQWGSGPIAPKSETATAMVTWLDVPSAESPLI